MREFPDRAALESVIGIKRTHAQAFKEDRPKQQAFKFTSTNGEKLPKKEKEMFAWDSTSSDEEEIKQDVKAFFGGDSGFTKASDVMRESGIEFIDNSSIDERNMRPESEEC